MEEYDWLGNHQVLHQKSEGRMEGPYDGIRPYGAWAARRHHFCYKSRGVVESVSALGQGNGKCGAT